MLGVVRDFFGEKNVLEVQTAILARYGVTEPTITSFKTDSGHYLQTSPEFQMKRLLAAGAPSIYQICPAFREGEEFDVDVHHDSELRLPEVARDHGLDKLVGRSDGVDFLVATALQRLPAERVFITKFPVDQAALAKT